jgi:Ca-activated chloride channel family protein
MFDGVYFEFPKVASFVFIFLACDALCKLRERGLYFPHLGAFGSVALKPSRWLWFLKWGAIVCLIAALMSPVKEKVYTPQSVPGHAVALVVDASESMRNGDFVATDRPQSRFEAVQRILSDFIKQRESDALGLVVFGTHAFVASPLTTEHELLSALLQRLYVGIAGKYTALYEAIAKGVALLHASDARSKILIVLSDGRNTPGAPVGADVAAALVQKEAVKVYAVLIGDAQEAQANALEALATKSGGGVYRAADADALAKVYAQIDALEPSPQRRPALRVKEYYYIYPLFVGFLFLMLYVYWRNRRAL